jgi:hypothetical protein
VIFVSQESIRSDDLGSPAAALGATGQWPHLIGQAIFLT